MQQFRLEPAPRKRAKRRVRLTREQAIAQGMCTNCRSQSAEEGTLRCVRCKAAHIRWRAKNKERVLAIAKRYRDGNPEKIRALTEKWRKENPEAQARLSTKNNLAIKMRKHGATLEHYEVMFAEQGGKCAICGSSESKNKRSKRLYVDHCHATNRVRGLLCLPCNSAIGFMEDDVARLQKAIAYLERSR
jgi:hypothetical protein